MQKNGIIRTVVAVFIRNKKLLMEKRSSSKKVYAGLLMCPSGHIEKNELLAEALEREMLEELDIRIEEAEFLFCIPDKDSFSKKQFLHYFLLIKKFKGKIKASKEAQKLFWLSYSQIKNKKPVPIVKKLVERLHRQKLI